MKTTAIKPSQAMEGDILCFYGYQFKIGKITKHEPSQHVLEHGRDYEKMPFYTCFGTCINLDNDITQNPYFNSHVDINGNRLPTGWKFQGNDNAKWNKVI